MVSMEHNCLASDDQVYISTGGHPTAVGYIYLGNLTVITQIETLVQSIPYLLSLFLEMFQVFRRELGRGRRNQLSRTARREEAYHVL